MKDWFGAFFWFVAGAAAGFSLLDSVGFGAYTLLPSLAMAVVFLALRLPGWWMWFVGAGSLLAVLWTLHIASGDTPDNSPVPIIVGVALAATGVLIRRRVRTR